MITWIPCDRLLQVCCCLLWHAYLQCASTEPWYHPELVWLLLCFLPWQQSTYWPLLWFLVIFQPSLTISMNDHGTYWVPLDFASSGDILTEHSLISPPISVWDEWFDMVVEVSSPQSPGGLVVAGAGVGLWDIQILKVFCKEVTAYPKKPLVCDRSNGESIITCLSWSGRLERYSHNALSPAMTWPQPWTAPLDTQRMRSVMTHISSQIARLQAWTLSKRSPSSAW